MRDLRIAILNGPNLDKLGSRETEIYGPGTYQDLVDACTAVARELGVAIEISQTQSEGALVERIHAAAETVDGIVLNAAAYTHTSVALRDALLCHDLPVVEVHISNPDAREPFRRENLIADAVTATVKGFGRQGYELALRGLVTLLESGSGRRKTP